MKSCFLKGAVLILLGFIFTIEALAAKPAPTPPKVIDPMSVSSFLVSLKNDQLTLERNGKQSIYLVTPETRYLVGMEEFPKKFLKPGIKIQDPPGDAGNTLSEVFVIPLFKKEKGSDSSTTGAAGKKAVKDPSSYFVSLEDDILTIEIADQKQLQKVDSMTAYRMGGKVAYPDFLKKGMKLNLSTTIPWGYVTLVDIIPTFKLTDPTADPADTAGTPEVLADTLNWYFVSLEDEMLTLENNGSSFLYLISSGTHVRVGKEEVPKKILLPGIKVIMPPTEPGTILPEISVVPVFKKDPTITVNPDQVDTTVETEWNFISINEEGMLMVEKDGQQQLNRVDSKTAYQMGGNTIKKEFLKKGMRVILSSNEPWSAQTLVKLVPTFKQPKPEETIITTTTTIPVKTASATKTKTTTSTTQIP